VQPPEELRRNEVTAAPPTELLQGSAHDLFRLAQSVAFSVIEKVDARIISSAHHFDGVFDPRLCVKRHPRAEGKLADLDAGLAKVAIMPALPRWRYFM
jgi:hypothetical protein